MSNYKPRGFREAWTMSSVFVKLGIIAVGLVLFAALLIGGKSWWDNKAYQTREAAREVERQAEEEKRKKDEAEKAQLRIEKERFETIANEATAQRDAYKQLAQSRRADRALVVKELEAVEADYAKRKKEVEAASGTMSDSELRDELCRRFRARGIPCPE